MNTEKTLAPFVNWFAIRPRTSGYLLSITLSLFIILISVQRYHILKEDQEREMSIILNDIHENIDQSLKNCQVSIVSLALTINDDGTPQNFDDVAKQLTESNPIIIQVQLIPDGIIKYVYPIKGNETSLNLNILDTSYLQEQAYKAIKSKAIYFDGPLKLKQGGIGIVGRLPVYKKNKFWGFSAAVIKLERLLKLSESSLNNNSKYSFQFSNINPVSHKEEFYLPSKIDADKTNYVSKIIPNSNWKIYLIEKNQTDLYFVILLRGLLGIVIAILFGFFTSKLLRNPEKLRILLKEQEKKLLTNEMKFKTVFDQATVGFAFIDANSDNFIEVNNRYCTILGFSQEEIIGENFVFFTHPDDINDSEINLKKLKEGIISEYSTEKRYISKSGKTIWVNLTVSPLWESNEKPNVNIAFIKDITEKKEAQALIENSKTRFKSLIDTIDGIVWEYNLETMTPSFISKKVESILGYTVKEWKSSTTFWEDHIHPDDLTFVLELSDSATKQRKNIDYEYRMITKSGKVIWIRDIVNFVYVNDKTEISRGIMIDITKMKEAQKNLNNSFHLVTEQNKRLLNFSYIVSHNLRSHTSNIESIISLIESAESEEERDQMMQLLKSVSNSLNETMSHLNEVVNINTNMSLVIKSLKLNHYISTTKNALSEQLFLTNTIIVTDIPDDVKINYNQAYLESILYNIISNAIKYRHPEKVPIINIKWYKEHSLDVIEISDNGIGIDLKKNGDKIFGLYKTFSNNDDSKGIGLYITKNQIEAMGGNITVESELNKGTTFKIYIK